MKLCPKCQKQYPDDANFCPVDAARLVPLEAKSAGADSLAARFELGEQIGGSRTGAVHRATEKTSGTRVAVKRVAPAVAQLPGVAQRLDRELQQLARVQSNGIAKVIASGKRTAAGGGDETWVAMELVDGAHTLAEAITARGPIPAAQAADLVEVIGEALIEAAQVGVVHRDLAPKNVLFAGGEVKLVNFSLPVPANPKVPGVVEFVAPEQMEGRPVDQRSNLYSLGAIYYYVLTGQYPSEHVMPSATGTGVVQPPSQLAPTIAAGSPIEAVIMRALERSPTKRFLTVRQFLDEVGRVGRGDVIELDKPIGPASKRPKADLISTLLGVAKGPAGAAAGAISSAPTVGTGVPSVQPSVIVQQSAPVPAPAAPVLPATGGYQQTMLGIPAHGAGDGDPTEQMAAVPEPVSVSAQITAPKPLETAAPGRPAVLVTPSPGPTPPTIEVIASPTPAAVAVAAPQVTAPVSPVIAASVAAAQAPAAAPAPVAVQPAVPAAPVVASPGVAASGKSTARDEKRAEKGKFRETMWFKKGELDAQAAQAAAEERARTGRDVSADKADSLPIDERYKDDGSITHNDKQKYSLRTGGTQLMKAVSKEAGNSMKVSEDELIGEMRGGRKIVFIAIGIGVVAIIAIVAMLVR